MTHVSLRTSRLSLVPHSPELWRAILESDEAFRQRFGAPLAAGLRDFMFTGDVSPQFLEQLRTAQGTDPWRWGFVLLDQSRGQAIGFAGYKGPPGTDGVIEISYGVAPGFQGKGYATEAARALIAFAFGHPSVATVIAHTRPECNPSTSVLTKCGFRKAGEVHDPEDGLVWRWELPRTTSA